MDESKFIYICLQQIEDKIGWKSYKEWTDGDFKKLAKHIKEASGISISPHTLKRLFGKVKYKLSYNPQEATKEALAKYLGHDTWDIFVEKNKQNADNLAHIGRRNKIFSKDIKPKSQRWKKIYGYLALILVVISIYFGFIKKIGKYRNHSFYIENPAGEVPHTVTFHFDVSKIKAKEILIDYDFTHPYLGGEFIISDRFDSIVNYTYQIPGVYHPRLKVNGQIIDSSTVIVRSDGWVHYFQGEADLSRYWLDNMVNHLDFKGYLTLTRKDIMKYGGDTLHIYYVTHRIFRNFGLSGNNFILEAKLKNGLENGGITCFDANIEIFAENINSSLRIVEKGCQSYSILKFGENSLTGVSNNLDILGRDISSWIIVRIEVNGRDAKLFFDDEEVYSGNYFGDSGEIQGLEFLFKGSGLVDYVSLKSIDGVEVYRDDFSSPEIH